MRGESLDMQAQSRAHVPPRLLDRSATAEAAGQRRTVGGVPAATGLLLDRDDDSIGLDLNPPAQTPSWKSGHAAKSLALVSRRISAGLPRMRSAPTPPARATSGVWNTSGLSSPSVPARANWRARAPRVAALGAGRPASQSACL